MALCTANVAAQTVTTTEQTISVVDNDGKSIVNIEQKEQANAMEIRVGGVNISFDARVEERNKQKRRFSTPMFGNLEVGMNLLNNVDYSIYDKSTMDQYGEFMDLNTARSLQFNILLTDASVRLCRSGRASIGAAIYLCFNDYTFDNNITLVKQNGIVMPQSIDQSYKKSKLNTFSVQIPVVAKVNLTHKIFVAGGVYGGALLGSHTKIKFPKEKIRRPYMTPFYAGLTARAGWDEVYAYGNWSLTELFQKDKGPAVTPITFGLGFEF